MTWSELKRRKDIMLCYPMDEDRLRKWSPPYLCQPKLDGMRCRARYDENGNLILYSSEANIIQSVPHINAAVDEILQGSDVEFDGELYVHGWSFERLFGTVSRSVNASEYALEVQYHIFDIADESRPQMARFSALVGLLHSDEFNPVIRRVPTYALGTPEGVLEAYAEFRAQRYEGLIVRESTALYTRRRSTQIMKFKPKRADYFRIVGTKEERDKFGNLKGTLGALILDAKDGRTFDAGSGFTREQRVEYWKIRDRLVQRIAKISFQHTTDKGKPRFPVFVEILK